MSVFKSASLVIVLALGACSAAPPQPASPSTPAVAANVHELTPVSSAAPATGAATATASAPGAAVPLTDDQIRHQALLKQATTLGFKPKLTNGVMTYCRSEVPLGTRFEHTVCHSENGMADLIQRTQRQQDELNDTHTCAGSGCMRH